MYESQPIKPDHKHSSSVSIHAERRTNELAIDGEAEANTLVGTADILWGDWQLHRDGIRVFRLGFEHGTVVATNMIRLKEGIAETRPAP